MASVYTNDLRLEEIGSGEQSGSWGDTTNTNLELIAEAFAFGTEAITTNADTHTTTIADGASDPGRALFLKYTGTLDSACTITIGPNTVSKLWFIENGTSGSQNIIISQGSGANITIPAGQTKAVYSNGGGSGAVMVDAFATLNVVDLLVDDDLTVTDDVAIGGLATIGETLAVTGVVTANAGVVVDNITIDGQEIDVSSGDLTLDVAGDILLNAGGGDIFLADDSVTFGKLKNSSSHFFIQSLVADKDILIIGNDGGSEVTAVEFDMSDAGTAIFNHDAKFSDAAQIIMGAGSDIVIKSDGANAFITTANGLLLVGQASYSGNAGGQFHFAKDAAGGATTLAISNTVNSDADAKARLVFGQYVRQGGFIESGRENGGDWGTTSVCDTYMAFATSIDNTNTEAMRINSAQHLLIGKTADDNTTTGTVIHDNGFMSISRSANIAMILDRSSNEGEILRLTEAGTERGSLHINGDRMLIDSAGDASGLRFDAAGYTPFKNGSTANGTVDLGFSAGRFKDLYLSGGAYLGGTGAANKLDDYEKGTFDPQIFVGETQQTLTRDAGYYVKVGNLVHCSMGIIVDGAISGSGAVTIRNFPFTSLGGDGGNARAAGSIGYTDATFMPAGILMGSSTVTASMNSNSTPGTTGTAFSHTLQGSALPSGWNMHFSVTYVTS